MSYHKDYECNSAFIELLDALCQWERATGRRSVLLLIPEQTDEKIIIAQDGKPLAELIEHPDLESIKRILDIAFIHREIAER